MFVSEGVCMSTREYVCETACVCVSVVNMFVCVFECLCMYLFACVC